MKTQFIRQAFQIYPKDLPGIYFSELSDDEIEEAEIKLSNDIDKRISILDLIPWENPRFKGLPDSEQEELKDYAKKILDTPKEAMSRHDYEYLVTFAADALGDI